MADVPALPADLDAVVHCAGDVSFNPPVDQAFTTNVVGTRGLLARAREVGDHVHYVHVSTAYVAGRRRGSIPEGPVDHDVDLEAELRVGAGAGTDRRPAVPRGRACSRGSARRPSGRTAGPGCSPRPRRSRRRRKEWVKEELVRLGTERARSLGWTDCYTFTKALGERVVEAHAAHAPVSIVRPSIIESALERPHPGWIEGFKMAEPLILAYGRGELPEFPAAADTIVDIVPVDHVVAALIAVLAHPPEPGSRSTSTSSSGARNPLTFRDLYDNVRGYFDEHPFAGGDRGAARLPDWRFPGAQSVERLLSTSERAHKVANYVIGHAPRSATGPATWPASSTSRAGGWSSCAATSTSTTSTPRPSCASPTTARWRSSSRSSPEDRETFAFDTSVVDWQHYLQDVHCPAVTEPIRKLDELRRSRKRGESAGPRSSRPASGWPRSSTWTARCCPPTSSRPTCGCGCRRCRPPSAPPRSAGCSARLPSLIRAERSDRGAFLRAIYREYAGARLAGLDEIVDEVLTDHVLARLAPAAVRRVREHRAAGHPTVLITGAIRPLTRPLAPLFDEIVAAELGVDDRGVCTGFLDTSPLTGESRAAWIQRLGARATTST